MLCQTPAGHHCILTYEKRLWVGKLSETSLKNKVSYINNKRLLTAAVCCHVMPVRTSSLRKNKNLLAGHLLSLSHCH